MSKQTAKSLPGLSTLPAVSEGYYSQESPNPHLPNFISQKSTSSVSDEDTYNIQAFSESIQTKKTTAIYNMHSYHQGKKPHDAIRQYIQHYTREGDIVLDPFCGSGGAILASLLDRRCGIGIDRSPAAVFVSNNLSRPTSEEEVSQVFAEVFRLAQKEIDWLYTTKCHVCESDARIEATVYSHQYRCGKCQQKVPLFDCVSSTVVNQKGKEIKAKVCPHCLGSGHKELISTKGEKYESIPVLVKFACDTCNETLERRHDDGDPRSREFFQSVDLTKLSEIESGQIPYWVPAAKMMNIEDDDIPWGAEWRKGRNFRSVVELFTKRNLWAMSVYFHYASQSQNPDLFRFALTSILLAMSRMQGYVEDPRFPNQLMRGTYYLPAVGREYNVSKWLKGKQKNLASGYKAINKCDRSGDFVLSLQSATDLSNIETDSIDYIFTDPPYSDTVQYGELNFIWEAWLNLDTRWHGDEIIVNGVRGLTEADWADKMRLAMAECYRVLKPGRWLSLCYHDSSEGTWQLVQDVMAEVGFLVDKTDKAIFIDTNQKSFNQRTADKATKRDLVLNFRKPKPSDWVVKHLFIPADADSETFQDMGKQVIRDFLTKYPGTSKDRIYDELVSRMVRRGEMESHNFDELLSSVAEEVQDDFGGRTTSRWYLKDTADEIDRAEQDKEDSAAERLESFIATMLEQTPELEGVHYSDLFEQVIVLSVDERPRRSFENWLPEYFFKTSEGTWRPPADEAERQQKAKIREAGTLRRMKRFANALIESVPVREQDRPDGVMTLIEWIRQCRRAGLYEQGRALYEKGGLDLTKLDDEEQIEVEDDYRICVKRGSEDKPKKKTKKKTKERKKK